MISMIDLDEGFLFPGSSNAHSISFQTIDGAKYRLESVIDDEKSIFGIDYIKQKLKSTIIDDDQVFLCPVSPTDVKFDMDDKMFLERSKSMPSGEEIKKSYSWSKKPRNSVNSSSDKRSAITSIEEEEFELQQQQQQHKDQFQNQIYKLDFASNDGGPILSGLATFEHQNSVISDFDTRTPTTHDETDKFNYGSGIKMEAKARNSLSSSIEWIFGLKKQHSIDKERKISSEVFDKDQVVQTAWVHEWVDSQGNSQKKKLIASSSLDEGNFRPPSSQIGEQRRNSLIKKMSLPVKPYEYQNQHQSFPSPSGFSNDGQSSMGSDEQVAFLKQREKKNRFLVQQLTCRVNDLQRQLEQTQRLVNETPQLHLRYLQQKNKSLNAEIIRLSTKWYGDKDEYAKCSRRVCYLTSELEQFKLDYVLLLQACIRVLLLEKQKDGSRSILHDFENHKSRIVRLCDEAKQDDPTFPTFASVTSENGYVDIYGFRHSFSDDVLALHYLSSRLRLSYSAQNGSQNIHVWKMYMRKLKKGSVSRKELRNLIKSGVPNTFRSLIWRSLVHQKISDLKDQCGKYYFNNLCTSQGENGCLSEANVMNMKQITLDIMRTMPSNVHFASLACKGVSQLQQVLKAFCYHNPHIGYCQGMNFLVAVALLFLNAEDTFWFLVAVTERYFSSNYFDQNLIGVQADQEVLKWLVERKLPALSQHLATCDIDLATITLNWFMSLFFDSIPFEIMLRIWDCFLLDGPKVLFRFALAILSMHQDLLLEKHDTMSILKVLKLSTRYTYDADALIKIAYEAMDPFPNRATIISKQISYLKILKERLKEREQYKAAALKFAPLPNNQIHISGVLWIWEDILLVSYGNRDFAQLGLVKKGSTEVKRLEIQFNCRVLSIVQKNGITFVGLISGYLTTLKIDILRLTSKICWEIKLTDMPLQLQLTNDGRLVSSLANGSLAILDNCLCGVPDLLELYYVPVGPAPICCLIADSDGQIWASMGSNIHVLNDQTLDCVEKFQVPNGTNNLTSSIFDRLVGFQLSEKGVWFSICQTSVVQLWDTKEFNCRFFYDIAKDCLGVHKKEGDPSEIHISSLLAFDDNLWIGTENGYLLTYKVTEMSLTQQVHPPLIKRQISSSAIHQSKTHFVPGILPKKTNADDFTVQALDSGYNSVASSSATSTKSGNFGDRRHSRSFPSFNILKLTNQWRSYDSVLCTQAGSVIAEGVVHEASTEGQSLIRPQLSWPDHMVATPSFDRNGSRKQSMSDSFGRRIVRRPFQQTLNRRRKTVASLSCTLEGGHNIFRKFDESRHQSINCSQTTISNSAKRSLESVTNSSPHLEFDDLFFLYDDDENCEGQEHGLCSEQVQKSLPAMPDLEKEIAVTVDDDLSDKRKLSNDHARFATIPTQTDIQEESSMDERPRIPQMAVGSKNRPLSLELRRKVLKSDEQATVSTPSDFLETEDQCFDRRKPSNMLCSETTSVVSSLSVEPQYTFNLGLKMRLKISDQPVTLMVYSGNKNQPKIVTCSGPYESSEAMLLWSPDENNKLLWYNEPIKTAVEKKTDKTRRKSSLWFR